MRLICLDTYDDVSTWAAKYIRNKIYEFKPGPDRYFTLGLPTGLYFIAHLPRCEKTVLRGFLPGPTQTGLYSHRRWLEALNFGFRK